MRNFVNTTGVIGKLTQIYYENDPMVILSGKPKILIDADVQRLSMLLRKAGLVACVVTMAICLLSIIFTNNPQNASEQKKNMINKQTASA